MANRKQSKTIIDKPARSTTRRFPRPLFFRWWKKNQSRFLIDLHWGPQDQGWMAFSFEGIHPALHGVVSDCGVSVGYICQWCKETVTGPPPLFANRLALLTNHLFEPLLEWVNEKLAPSHWLILRAIPGVTDAEITIEPPAANHDPSSKWVTQVLSLRSPFNESVMT